MIPETHPLQQLFIELVGRHYAQEIGIRDPQIVNYVAHLMAVAATVLERGGDEDTAIAALLHNAAEDRSRERQPR